MNASDIFAKYKSYIVGGAGLIYGVYLLTQGQGDAGVALLGTSLGLMGLRFQFPVESKP